METFQTTVAFAYLCLDGSQRRGLPKDWIGQPLVAQERSDTSMCTKSSLTAFFSGAFAKHERKHGTKKKISVQRFCFARRQY